MASVNSQAGLFSKKGYSPSGTDENMPNGCDIELQVRTPQKPTRQLSYENLDDRDFTEDALASHQYEEPVDIRSRNRERALQDPSASGDNNCNRRKRKQAGDKDCTDGYHKSSLSNAFKIVVFAAFLLALAAVVLAVLLMVGGLSVPACRKCKKELVVGHDPSGPSEASGSTQELWEAIKQLRSILAKLNAEVKVRELTISKLQRDDLKNAGKIQALERKASYRIFVFNDTTFNISSYLGQQTGVKGENGSNGLTGQTGPGNMTLCRYMSKEGAPYTPDFSGNGQNVIVSEPEGHRIIGATCSTLGASEYNLKSGINAANVRQYECECRGKSSVFLALGGRAQCIIHYWMCA